MNDAPRNDGLHEKHPGRGKAGVIELESSRGRVEDGGFMVFLPSGATKVVAWHQATPITPTLEAAKDFATVVVNSLIEAGGPEHPDIMNTNWTSIAAAIQRVILDWNHKVQVAARSRMHQLVDIAGKPLLH